MLDNFTVDNVHKGVSLVANRYETEVSGGITLEVRVRRGI
jgi:nicotinate-nucleotide pyrophosphorylase